MPKKSTATVSAPAAPKAAKAAPKAKAPTRRPSLDGSHELREALRQAAISCEDKRQLKPLEMSLIAPLVVPEYADIFTAAVKDREKVEAGKLAPDAVRSRVVEIDLFADAIRDKSGVVLRPSDAAVNFVRGWMLANGFNRESKGSHYTYLAKQFRKGFSADATHWVLGSDGAVDNGGHSGKGVCLAWFPSSTEYGVQGVIVSEKVNDIDTVMRPGTETGDAYLDPDFNGAGFYFVGHVEDGSDAIYASKPLDNPEFQRVGQSADGKQLCYVAEGGTDNGPDWTLPEFEIPLQGDATGKPFAYPDSAVIRLVVNADPLSCLKMDDVRLSASYMDMLEQIGELRTHMRTALPGEVKASLVETLRVVYLRLKHPKGDGFGIASKGGNLNKADIQFWYLALMPSLLDCCDRMSIGQPPVLQGLNGYFVVPKGSNMKGGIKLFHWLSAGMLLLDEERDMLCKLAIKQWGDDKPAWATNLKAKFIVSSGSPTESNDTVITALIVLAKYLVAYGLGLDSDDETIWDAVSEVFTEHTEDDKTYRLWQVEEGRGSGWDVKGDEYGEDWNEVLAVNAARISTLLGSSEAADSQARKAGRKNATPRKSKA